LFHRPQDTPRQFEGDTLKKEFLAETSPLMVDANTTTHPNHLLSLRTTTELPNIFDKHLGDHPEGRNDQKQGHHSQNRRG